jgi:hypothetical protein
MATENGMTNRSYGDAQIPVTFQSLCSELSHTGQLYLRQISAVIDELAPQPGVLVYTHVKKLAVRLDGLEPIVFSAIDASTHLQVAQIHLAMTTAAAVSFVDFAVRSFPFRIQQMRTRHEMPFHNNASNKVRHDFAALMAQRDIVHSFITDLSPDALSCISSKLLFGGMSESYMPRGSERELQWELAQFLFFHNNYRSVPWLDGQTPLQKLKTFDGFAWMHSFNPSAEWEARAAFPEVRLPEAQPQLHHANRK